MGLKESWVDILDKLWLIRVRVVKRIDLVLFVLLFLGFLLSVYEIAVPKEANVALWVNNFLRQVPRLAMLLYLLKWLLQNFIRKQFKLFNREHLPDLVFFMILLMFNQFKHSYGFLESEWFLYILLSVFFIVRLMREGSNIKNAYLTPSALFIISFAMLIFVGTAVLLVPVATNGELSFIDAFFTATSAVCVTGLVVVDTSSKFTEMGQDFLLVLIQIGGLGLMTFTNFFAILFRGGMSFKSHLILTNLIETDKPNSLFSTLIKIMTFTIIVELLGIFLIYLTTSDSYFAENGQSDWMFSVFHSISAFCNAGFSTLPEGLFNSNFRYNYAFQLVICFLVILGGIGFPVVIDLYDSVKGAFKNLIRTISFGERYSFQARNVNVHSRLVLYATAILLGVGSVLYFITEYNNALAEHTTIWGKLVQSFFGAVTPRTAGFNTVDTGELMQGTILIYLLLMWIGASPSSTGGGIKTTTFTIAISNVIALARGKGRLDLFKREIAHGSIHRAFAVVFLSLLIIGVAIFLISIFEPKQPLTEIAFECFSAYSTVGLTMNLTPQLSDPSKLVLIVTMFLGRVGMFTLLFGLFTNAKNNAGRYPKENVLIT